MKELLIRLGRVDYAGYLKDNRGLLVRYVVSGISSMLFELGAFYFLVYICLMNPVFSSNGSLLLAGIFNYFLSRYWVFVKTENVKREIILFFIVFLISLLINNGIFLFSMEFMKLSPLLSKCAAILISTGFNYLTKKYIVFKALS